MERRCSIKGAKLRRCITRQNSAVNTACGRRLRLNYSKRRLPAVLSLQDRFIYKKTAEHFAKPINKLKGKVTMLFITLQIPRGLQVDEVFSFEANQQVMKMGVIEDEAVKRYPMNEGW